MSQMNEDAHLYAKLMRDGRRRYIIIQRGKLASMRVRMSEATALADQLVDIIETKDGDRQ